MYEHNHKKACNCPRYSYVLEYLKSLKASKIKEEWLNGFGIKGEIKVTDLNLTDIKDLCNTCLCLCTIRINYNKVDIIFHDELEYFYEKPGFFKRS